MQTHASAEAALRDVYGFEAFRGVQADAIAAAVSGEDVLAVMATGGGKSLCYQVPALVRGAPVVVVSPLVSLMNDQVAALQARGLAARALASGVESFGCVPTGAPPPSGLSEVGSISGQSRQTTYFARVRGAERVDEPPRSASHR